MKIVRLENLDIYSTYVKNVSQDFILRFMHVAKYTVKVLTEIHVHITVQHSAKVSNLALFTNIHIYTYLFYMYI